MDKTRGYQASIDYLMPIVEHPSMSGEYCRHLRNSIDAMMKFERIQSELKRLNAENAKLRAVADAARGAVAYLRTQPTIQHILVQALAEVDKEGE